MNITSIKNYDILLDLPTDESLVSEQESQIFTMLFKEEEKKEVVDKTSSCFSFNSIREPLLIGILFAVFSLPQVNVAIGSLLPLSEYMMIFLKMLILIIILWILRNR